MLDLVSSATALIALGFTFYLVTAQLSRRRRRPAGARRALLVCAHPDDECMFFGPAVLGLLRDPGCTVYLLCLSTGDYEGRGKVRKEELYRSCTVLGIKRENVILLRHSRMPDSPQRTWNDALLAEIVLHHVSSLDVDTVITFDRQGVSYHKNHRSCYFGLLHLVRENLLPAGCQVYCVPTVNRLRKYSSFLDLPLTLLSGDVVFVASIDEWTRIQHAMGQHRSQLAWFRVLYMMFSRYVFINSLEALRAPAPAPAPAAAAAPIARPEEVGDVDAADDSSTGEFASPPESPVPSEPTDAAPGHDEVSGAHDGVVPGHEVTVL